MPPPTGVVIGPLIATEYSRTASSVSSRQPFVGPVDARRLLARIDLHPVDPPRAVVRLLDGRVDDVLHHRRDVDADAVALDERDDRVVGRRLPGDDLGTALGNPDEVVVVDAQRPTGKLPSAGRGGRAEDRGEPAGGVRPALPALPRDERPGEEALRQRRLGRRSAPGQGTDPVLRRAGARICRAAPGRPRGAPGRRRRSGRRRSSATSACSSTTSAPSSRRRSSTR